MITSKRLYEVFDVAFAARIIMQIHNVMFMRSGGVMHLIY